MVAESGLCGAWQGLLSVAMDRLDALGDDTTYLRTRSVELLRAGVDDREIMDAESDPATAATVRGLAETC